MSGWTPSDEQRRQEGEDIPRVPPGGTRRSVTPHDDLATVRRMTGLIRDAVGFALAEKNIPHEPTWTLLVPQHLDDIEASASRLETELARLREQVAALTEERDTLAEAQQFPVETVMSWKRRAEGAEAMNRYARILLDPQRQDEPDEENALRAYEALSGIPLTVPADRVLPERTLELVRDVCERGVGPDTTPEEALQTIENLINKRHPREQL